MQGRTPEQVIASLPTDIREALEQDNEVAFDQAYDALSPEEKQIVVEAMQYLQTQQEEEASDATDLESVDQEFEPLLQAIAGVALRDTSNQSEIEQVLADLETKGYHIREAVQGIWAGGRDAAPLTVGLDEMDAALVHRVLEIIGEAKE